MRLRFSPDDEDAFNEARDTLLDEFAGWLDRPEPEGAELVGDAGLFLDWRHGYSTGVLDEYTEGDVAEFLLAWCPRKLSVPAEDADGVCEAVGAYIEFMAGTNRLVGGVKRAATLARQARDLVPAMRAEMNNSANFGMAKSLFAGLGDVSGLSMEELKGVVQQQMDAHNALPIEQRRGLTDRFFEPEPEPEVYDLPFVYVPPTAAEVEAAAEVPILAKVRALREYLGPEGKPLTEKGNLKLADGRALIDLLDTGDEMDERIGDKTFRTVSTADLPRLMFVVDVAKQAGAVRSYRRRLVPTKSWAGRSTVPQAIALAAAIIELGPLQTRFSARIWLYDALRQLLDEGIAAWLSPLLGPFTAVPFEVLLEMPTAMATEQFAAYWPETWSGEGIGGHVRRDMGRMLELLELGGVLRWTDRIEVPDTYGPSSWTGGTIELTALGRHVLPDYVDAAGLVLHRADDLADADGGTLIDALFDVDETQHEQLLAGWQPDRSPAERAQLLTEAITAAESAADRAMGFHSLDLFAIEVVEPLVRQLLDSSVAGHAALWLIARDRADMATLGRFIDTAVRVDLLAADLADPEQLCMSFTAVPAPLRLLDEMWREPTAEVALILDLLGTHLSDPKLSKAARKAAMRHRSWLANRQ